MKRKIVIVSGSLAFDRIFNYPRRFSDAILPEKVHVLNVSFTVDDIRESFGGTAGNIAYTLQLLGVQTAIVSGVGIDFKPYRAWLRRHRIDVSAVATDQHTHTASAYIITDRDDNQITAFHAGALRLGIRRIFPKVRALERRTSYAIIAPGNTSAMIELAREYVRHGISFLFDPGQALPALGSTVLRYMLQHAAGFISNDYELDLTLRRSGLSASRLFATVPYVVTTFGRRGAVLRKGHLRWRIAPARPQSEIDPTGAGDAFRAGLIAGIVRGLPFPLAARMGAVASVYTIEREGTQTHHFTLESFARRYARNYHESLPLN